MRVRPIRIGRLLSNRVGIEPTRFDQGFQRRKRRFSPLSPLETLIRLEGLDVPLNESYRSSDF
ncbi:MAG: hypothetical protein AAF599_02785 [Bacteroidota bacterium]